MNYSQVFPGLYLINLDQKMVGFRDFISSWLYMGEKTTFLVDPGPTYSVDALLETLKRIGVTRIDHILLTHIHIDHAGGTGKVVEAFPEAKVVCHPKGIGHMVDPSKLWKGSLKVLGEIAESYGEILPVPENAIGFEEEIETGDGHVKVTETPGHAVHHLSYSFKEYLFAGEVTGLNHSLPNKTYARLATPPVFKLEISLASLDKAIALQPEIVCFGHYGFRKDAAEAMKTAREQLLLWTEVAREQLSDGQEDLEERIFEALLKNDPVFANFKYLDEDIQKREDYFVRNSIKGIVQFLNSDS
ncbi:MAG: MBL fold metallo-hydrolase [Proteobacteria bacterium]|nr:MBL fold metallo-hydrolase [Pseudomonadota bacterium]